MERNKGQYVVDEEDLDLFVRSKFISIGWRFLFYFFFISILPVFIIGYSMIQKNEFVVKNEIKHKLESVATLKTSELSFWMNENKYHFQTVLNGRQDLIGLISQMMEEKTNAGRGNVRIALTYLLEQSAQFSEFFLIDPESGKVVVSTNSITEGQNNLDSNYFKEGKEDFFVGSIYYSTLLDDDVLIMSMPVKDSDGRLLSVFVGRVDLEVLYNFLSEKTGLGKTGEPYMVSRFYKSILAKGYSAEPIIKDLGGAEKMIINIEEKNVYTEGVVRALNGESGTAIYKNYNNQDVIGYYQNFPEFGLVFLVEQSVDEAFSSITNMRDVLILILFIVILVDAVLAFIVGRSLAKPLKELAEKAKRVQDGDFGVVTEVSSDDEFGILSHALDKMAESLILSLDETKNIINTMPSALFILDVDGNIQSSNKSAFELTEYDEFKLIGKPFSELIRYNEGEDEQSSFNLDVILKLGILMNEQALCFTNGHQTIPISLSGTVLKSKKGGKNIGFIIIIQDLRQIKEYAKQRVQEIAPILHKISLGDFSQKFDIPSTKDEFTELIISLDLMSDNLSELIEENKKKTNQIKKSKEIVEEEKAKAESLLSSIGEGLIAFDMKGNILLMNPAAEKLFKKTFIEILGKNYCSVFYFEDEKGNRLLSDGYPIADVIKYKKQMFINIFYVKEDGSKFPLATTFSPILSEDKILGVIVTFRDITKEMEVDKAKSEFVSLASHQLRTPLSGINWLLQEIQRKGHLDELQTEYLHDALRSNERMVHLVSDLLNVSRLETGIINVGSKDTDVGQLISDVVRDAEVIAKDNNQRIKFERPEQKVVASLDVELISQVVTNLLSNAITYSDKNKTITVFLEKTDNHILIKVKDQGIGISKKDQEKLFTKFYRTKEASRYSTTGSGLGLYIIRKVLEVCKGDIKCDSDTGKGTTFIIELPLNGPILKADGEKKLIEQKLAKITDS